MHQSAFENARIFYDKYIKGNFGSEATVVEFGSYDVNGTLKPIFSSHKYVGIDMFAGPNVDIVSNSHSVPLEDASVDVILSSSNFEHDDQFWTTILEMCRLIKPGGYIYICAPSAGPYHGHPGDCWRFYADSWKALEKWSIQNKYNITLVESYICQKDGWKDSIGIYKMN
jgi:SAM-dependent methyltransferase